MSLSLIAVFIPILLMGGIVGRFFREFAVTLSVAILISLVVSLTTTPMMCARLLRPESERAARTAVRVERARIRAAASRLRAKPRLGAAHGILMMLMLLRDRLPQRLPVRRSSRRASSRSRTPAGSSASSRPTRASRSRRCSRSSPSFVDIVRADPAVENVVGFTGGGQRNTGWMFVALKPLAERKESADQIIARLRAKLAKEPGANLFLNPVQDIRVGGRQANAHVPVHAAGGRPGRAARLGAAHPRGAVATCRELADVNTDQQDKGLQTSLVIDRDAAARLGVTPR